MKARQGDEIVLSSNIIDSAYNYVGGDVGKWLARAVADRRHHAVYSVTDALNPSELRLADVDDRTELQEALLRLSPLQRTALVDVVADRVRLELIQRYSDRFSVRNPRLAANSDVVEVEILETSSRRRVKDRQVA